jgi:nucleoside-diphosphate-sugar epimerase
VEKALTMNNNILVVGPNGFLASQLIARLRNWPHHRIIALGTNSDSIHQLDAVYSDLKRLNADFPEIHVIYLLGSFIPYGMFDVPNSLFVKSNIHLVAELSLLYPNSRIIFSSSVSVYGHPIELPLKIGSPFSRPDLYGLSKIAGEAIIKNHTSYAIIRFSSIVGRGMSSISMIPKMINASRNGKITVLGNGERLQNYIDVRDAVDICLKAASMDIQMIVLGVGERSYSNAEVAKFIQSFTGADIESTGYDTSPSFVYDVTDSYTMLNFQPKYTLQQSLKEIIE